MKYLCILFLVALFSCKTEIKQKVDLYYDTDSLMRAQKELLIKSRAHIIKKASINGKVSEGTVTPDSMDAWNKEFQIFEKININKPALEGVYQIKEYGDSRSNLTVREYYAGDNEVEVPVLKLFYLKDPENLRMLQATYVEANPIFRSRRKIKMIFDDFTGKALLHRYMITGGQKMILTDSVNFSVKAEIELQVK